jgi:cullin 3
VSRGRDGRRGASARVALTVSVLTTGFWPTAPCAEDVSLPAALRECCDDFKAFYLEKHTGRRLVWQTSMGTGVLTATFRGRSGKGAAAGSDGAGAGAGPAAGEGQGQQAKGTRAAADPPPGARRTRKELVATTYQMCILLLYADEQTTALTLGEIRERTRIPLPELKRHLVSLCVPKCSLLIKSPHRTKFSKLNDSDTFTFNEKFKSRFFRVKVPLVTMKAKSSAGKAGKGGREGVPAPVEEDRRHLIEAAVVRIMKARMQLDHNALIAEVSRQLSARFRPMPQQIKKRIESLIEREYLERSKEDRKVYHYLA